MHIQPSTSTSSIVRVVGTRRAVIAAIAALACAGLASACGSSSTSSTSGSSKPVPNLNTLRVQKSIEQNILSQRHLHAKVVCPTVVPQEQGKVFECVATTHSTAKPSVEGRTPFVVTIQNKSGYVTYIGK